MQPNQPQYSIDYLNQIAPEQKKPGVSNKVFFLALGCGLLLAIIVFILMLNSGGGTATTKSRLETLSARIATLQTISQSATSDITSNQLNATNGNLEIALTNAARAIQEPLADNKIDATKIPQSILDQEAGDDLTSTLADAKLNAIYDRVYAREMSLKISTTLALMSELYNGTKNESLRNFLDATTKDLKPINTQLAEFKDVY